MVLDATERSMMQSVLNGNGGIEFLLSIERAPRDESLLRNIRRELDSAYRQNQQNIQNNIDSRIKTK